MLKDEGSDAYITLIVPAVLRASLTPQKTTEYFTLDDIEEVHKLMDSNKATEKIVVVNP